MWMPGRFKGDASFLTAAAAAVVCERERGFSLKWIHRNKDFGFSSSLQILKSVLETKTQHMSNLV